jgi:hypothetical protein
MSGASMPPDFQSPPPAQVRNRLPLASLILGLVSLCLGIITGIPAIICGIIGLKRISRQPEVYAGKRFAIGGIILGCVGIVLWAVAVAAYPSLLKFTQKLEVVKQKAEMDDCALKLRNLGLAARIYAVDHGETFPQSYLDIKADVASPKILFCHADKRHHPVESWDDFNPSNSSYELLTPGARESDILQKPVFRCKVHGFYVVGDGSVVREKRP